MAIDWLAWTRDPEGDARQKEKLSFNWTKRQGLEMRAFPGGAMFLSHMLSLALAGDEAGEIVSYHLDKIENVPPREILHSITVCGNYPVEEGSKEQVFRVKHPCGYSGPDDGVPPPPLMLEKDDPDASVVVLDDAGNGFRERREAWPAALVTPGKTPLVLLKMSYPLVDNPLCDHLIRHHKERLVVIVTARDLRATGADISYQLSWEQTAETFVRQIQNNSRIRSLAMGQALIVRFGVEGAILCLKKEGKMQAHLFYDPAAMEDVFFDRHPGSMQGMSCAFVAGFTASFLKAENFDDAIRTGMGSSRGLVRKGFGSFPGKPDYSFEGIFPDEAERGREIADISIPKVPLQPDESRPRWTILESITRSQLEEIAENIVVAGTHPSLNPVPVGTFGSLKTIDRQEIESYQSIRNILQEYISSDSQKPVSIAVFGPPGSGKSFGVTQLARSLAREKIIPLEFNLSQFRDTQDLVNAFNAVQDRVLEGKLPLVFFDEFDADFFGPLGWLKYFLAPMQDGKFKDGETMHPVGRSIFIFAGGTCTTFREFCDGKDPSQTEEYEDFFRSAKGADFVSRLRGFVDIIGCTRAIDQDSTCIVRRALILRSLVEQNFKNLIDQNGKARIDPALVRAFLHVHDYRHGVRSIQAILHMSRISKKNRFDISDLPSTDQLSLHVDVPMFTNLLLEYSLLESAIEAIAHKFHEHYLVTSKTPTPSGVPWDELPEEYRESNREEARHITEKLKSVSCWFRPGEKEQFPLYRFDKGDLLTMAKMEHVRWCHEKRRKGWKYGVPRDDARRLHPDLVPWDKLSREAKMKDCHAVEEIPKIMAGIGFEIYKKTARI